jgi:hypothetical protein
LSFEAGVDAIYTISVNEINGFDLEKNIILEDIETEVLINILPGTAYDFTSSPKDDHQRFLLHLNPDESGLEDSIEQIYAYSFDKTIYVLSPYQTSGSVFIYNIMGQKINQVAIEGLKTIIPFDKEGSYIVHVISNNGTSSSKIIVK